MTRFMFCRFYLVVIEQQQQLYCFQLLHDVSYILELSVWVSTTIKRTLFQETFGYQHHGVQLRAPPEVYHTTRQYCT